MIKNKVKDDSAQNSTGEDKTEADKMWDEIKFRPIEMFALPNQLVAHYCKPIDVEPTKLYLVSSATSVLPSLETAIGPNYSLEMADKYIIVSRVVPSLTKR